MTKDTNTPRRAIEQVFTMIVEGKRVWITNEDYYAYDEKTKAVVMFHTYGLPMKLGPNDIDNRPYPGS